MGKEVRAGSLPAAAVASGGEGGGNDAVPLLYSDQKVVVMIV